MSPTLGEKLKNRTGTCHSEVHVCRTIHTASIELFALFILLLAGLTWFGANAGEMCSGPPWGWSCCGCFGQEQKHCPSLCSWVWQEGVCIPFTGQWRSCVSLASTLEDSLLQCDLCTSMSVWYPCAPILYGVGTMDRLLIWWAPFVGGCCHNFPD